VAACDPSPPFVEACRARHPSVDVREGRAESLPFDDGVFDAALAQLVLHFVSDPAAAAQEMRRVVRPGGVVAACVWDFSEGMEMLRGFWDAALAVLPAAPDEASTLRFGAEGEMAVLFRDAGLERVEESMLTVRTEYRGFDELWSSLLRGIGPAGSYLVARSDEERAAIREQMFERLGAPTGPFSMGAAARCATARVPG
jgi:SAM-dependent methyltransferase